MVDVDFVHPDGRNQRIRKVSPVPTKRGAEAYERELRNSLVNGQYGKEEEEKAPRFKEFAQEFLETYAKVNNKPSEVSGKEMTLRRHLNPHFGKLRLDEIDPLSIERFKAKQIQTGLKAKTVNNHLVVLRTMLNVAKLWGKLKLVPDFKRLKAQQAKMDFLTFEEAERLVAAATEEPQWHSVIVLALNTGLRLGELLALRWEDCDFVSNNLTVSQSNWMGHIGSPKSGRGRVIPLNSKARDALMSQRHLKGPLVWCQLDGTTYKKDHFVASMRRIRKRAGLRHFEWHMLRHSFASHLVMRGVALKAIQELLGHASIEMTMRYAHLSPDVRRSAVDVLVQASGTLTALRPKNGVSGVSE